MRYHSAVIRTIRTIATAALALALAIVPLVGDWCAVACETAHTKAAPSCHHTTSSTTRMGQPPAPCGHDHRPVLLDPATTTNPASRAVFALSTLNHLDVAAAVRHLAAMPSAPDPDLGFAPLLALTLSSPLRI